MKIFTKEFFDHLKVCKDISLKESTKEELEEKVNEACEKVINLFGEKDKKSFVVLVLYKLLRSFIQMAENHAKNKD